MGKEVTKMGIEAAIGGYVFVSINDSNLIVLIVIVFTTILAIYIKYFRKIRQRV